MGKDSFQTPRCQGGRSSSRKHKRLKNLNETKKKKHKNYGQYTQALGLTEPSLTNTWHASAPARTHVTGRCPKEGESQCLLSLEFPRQI